MRRSPVTPRCHGRRMPITGDSHGTTARLHAGHRWSPLRHGQIECRSPVTPTAPRPDWVPVTGDPHAAAAKLSTGHRWPPWPSWVPVTGDPHGQVECRSPVTPLAKLSAGHRWPLWHSTCEISFISFGSEVKYSKTYYPDVLLSGRFAT